MALGQIKTMDTKQAYPFCFNLFGQNNLLDKITLLDKISLKSKRYKALSQKG